MQWLTDIKNTREALWQNTGYPFVSPNFLLPLQNTGCIGGDSGWQPHYLTNHLSPDQQRWVMPAFVKAHSYGEYVFDWSWAEAYQKHGLEYYPKLLIAAPFTPATGPRHSGLTQDEFAACLPEIEQHCQEQGLSSAHYLFANATDQTVLDASPWHRRTSVQFHWFNREYRHFDDFLSDFKSRKRKAVLKERNSLRDQGIRITQQPARDVDDALWHFFYLCYQNTYAKRGMQGYLTLDAFKQLAQRFPHDMVLMTAYGPHQQPVACALFFKDDTTLYGRYWGCTHEIPGLHFELCYYQGIEYCIEHGLSQFNPGTQGEHKISRGFEPVECFSYHWLAHEGFSEAVARFVKEEAIHMTQYRNQCRTLLPFKHD